MLTEHPDLLRWKIPAVLWLAILAIVTAPFIPVPWGILSAFAFVLSLTIAGFLAFYLPAMAICPPAALLLLLVLLVPSRLLPSHDRRSRAAGGHMALAGR